MFGAIIGDIVGSPYEFDANNIKTKEFPLFSERSEFTDDSVMTLAVAKGIMDTENTEDDEELRRNIINSMRELGRYYPDAGYGFRFSDWLDSDDPKPYNSYGNGSAMRVSSVAWIFDSIDEVRRAARISAEVTHNHPEGIKGAEATASAVFMARSGFDKTEIKEYITKNFGYDLSRTCDEIRPEYRHVESCQQTVPEAITAFLEGMSFEDVIRTAVSLGGDSDTLTAIAGSIAEAYYGISEDWKKAALSRLPNDLAQILRRFDIMYGSDCISDTDKLHEAVRFAEKAHRGQKRKGTQADYIIHPMEVYSILMSVNASADVLAAGILHDTIEDTDTEIEDIEANFGERTACLVRGMSEDKSKSWKERKQHTIDCLKNAERDLKLLILADKVSNMRSMLYDYKCLGEQLWDRFREPKNMQSWYYSGIQDALADLQNDPWACNLYWEMVSLYKDLFVEYCADLDNGAIYQTACGAESYIYMKDSAVWESFSGEVPETAVPVQRMKAERLEDYWKNEYYDNDTVGNQETERAIDALEADCTDDDLFNILCLIRESMERNGHFIVPVEEKEEDKYYQRSVELENGEITAAVFTNMLEANKAPETTLISVPIREVLTNVKNNEHYSGIMINPWGNYFYMPKSWLDIIFDDGNKQ